MADVLPVFQQKSHSPWWLFFVPSRILLLRATRISTGFAVAQRIEHVADTFRMAENTVMGSAFRRITPNV